jgi:proline iminopeptidase
MKPTLGFILALGLVAQAPNEGYVDAGAGVRLFYRMVGTGRDTIVVLHGGPGFTMEYLAADLEPLAARHVLLFYDQRGAGRSTLVADSASLDAHRFADDLEAIRKHFGMQRLTLLGHSWGGGLAALYASTYPDRVGRMIIVDGVPLRRHDLTEAFTSLDARRDAATNARVAELRAARVANASDAAACRAYYDVWFIAAVVDANALRRSKGDLCFGSPASLANKVKNVDRYTMASLGEWDWRAPLRRLAAPTLIVHGDTDFIPVETAREWAATVPNATLVVLEKSGHFPYLEVPARFFAAIDGFLATTRARSFR